MTAAKDASTTEESSSSEMARMNDDTAVCFDGGCDPYQSPLIDEIERELILLSEKEKSLRREGALMMMQKLQEQDMLETSPVPAQDGKFSESAGTADSVISTRLEGNNGPTVWGEFGGLAAKTGGVNLGQGFPNWNPPQFVLDAAVDAVTKGSHQYTRSAGHPALVKLLAARYSMHLQREINAEQEISITVGASQALFMALQALLSPGDEAILIEPFFDLYLGQIRLAGGSPVTVPLEPKESGAWELDSDRLRAAITPKTRVLILNSPHNPTGKVFSRTELEAIAEVVRENPRVVVISDEVYKYILHSTPPSASDQPSSPLASPGHVHFASLDGMWDRTLTVSSAGKTFSVTGWQVGWIVGPAAFLRDVHTLTPYVQFCAATPMQEALARVLTRAEQPYEGKDSYYEWLQELYSAKMLSLRSALESAGIIPMKGEGGFFLIGDTRNLKVPQKYLEESTPAMPRMTRDWACCRWLAIEHGIIAIPCSPFFSEQNRGMAKHYVRFAFCKTDDTLEEAARAFAAVAESAES
eukprot:CAMPEP_0196721502 /NCGR_PEP_ID=MMETSP1091-20130531/4030_1 /TAXON_ID=302021 /ORGANISM="Rhodomonas sp., Strain CCMP768" /LENGTH=527 /DNA_ID=CAMNT_0042062977 /DNA_START=178 /DNA_END=1761 /DNA_ORIENTATION=-